MHGSAVVLKKHTRKEAKEALEMGLFFCGLLWPLKCDFKGLLCTTAANWVYPCGIYLPIKYITSGLRRI